MKFIARKIIRRLLRSIISLPFILIFVFAKLKERKNSFKFDSLLALATVSGIVKMKLVKKKINDQFFSTSN